MSNGKYYLIIVIFLFTLSSCMNRGGDDEGGLEVEMRSHGLFVVNEGNFMYDNASLSYYDFGSGEVINDVFFDVNGMALGDVAQSMTIKDSTGFVVVNNSGKIYAINTNTFKMIGKITGLTSPRYMHIVNDEKAYVTDLYSYTIHIVNPSTYEKIGEIDVHNGYKVEGTNFYQHATEQMVQHGNLVFTNCWSYDNKILVINTDNDEVVDSIETIKQPQSMVIDKHDKLWVLCDGGFVGSAYGYEIGGLMRIDIQSMAVEQVIRFAYGDYPSELTINKGGDTLYYLNKDVYRMNVSDTIPQVFLPRRGSATFGGYYGLFVNPSDSHVFVADAKNMTEPGEVIEWSATDASEIRRFKVGIIPGAFCMK